MSRRYPCADCNGSAAVPAGGGEPAADVDNGYVLCPTCRGTGTEPAPVQGELGGVAVESVQVAGQTDLLAMVAVPAAGPTHHMINPPRGGVQRCVDCRRTAPDLRAEVGADVTQHVCPDGPR